MSVEKTVEYLHSKGLALIKEGRENNDSYKISLGFKYQKIAEQLKARVLR